MEEDPGAEAEVEGREDDDESSVDSLMAESPGKYDQKLRDDAKGSSGAPGQDQFKMIDEEELIKKVTKKKIPKKKPAKVAPIDEKQEIKPRPPRFSQLPPPT